MTATRAQLAYRAQRFHVPSEEGALHRDGRWECMNFDTEAGHSCAHCGAPYRHHEPVEHEEACPHSEGWTPKALLGKGDDLELPHRVDALFLALDVALKRCAELEAEIDRLLLALANKGGAA